MSAMSHFDAKYETCETISCISVCKFKAHKRCAVRASCNCKWTTLAAIGQDIIEDEDGVSSQIV